MITLKNLGQKNVASNIETFVIGTAEKPTKQAPRKHPNKEF